MRITVSVGKMNFTPAGNSYQFELVKLITHHFIDLKPNFALQLLPATQRNRSICIFMLLSGNHRKLLLSLQNIWLPNQTKRQKRAGLSEFFWRFAGEMMWHKSKNWCHNFNSRRWCVYGGISLLAPPPPPWWKTLQIANNWLKCQ